VGRVDLSPLPRTTPESPNGRFPLPSPFSMDESVPIGEVVRSHSVSLSRVAEDLNKKADLTDVTSQFVALQKRMQEDFSKV